MYKYRKKQCYVKVSKNLVRCRSENNFFDQDDYVGISSKMSNVAKSFDIPKLLVTSLSILQLFE